MASRIIVLRKMLRLFHTLRYLKPIQIYGRVWFKLYRPAPDNRPAPARRFLSREWVLPVQKTPRLIQPWRFRFLNEEHDCIFPADWNAAGRGKLWLYNLHYFDDLLTVSAGERSTWHEQLLERWIIENPPAQGNGWEPYPISLRLVNWTKWSLAGNELSAGALQSLAVQARFLRKRLEVHLLGNHLFANAKALVFTGLFFAGAEAEEWLQKGLDILSREIPEQILEDGGHFERSPMYHAIILEDMLDLFNVMQGYGRDEVSCKWKAIIREMLDWLHIMSHPDGEIALFNDAAQGISSSLQDLAAYAHRLGVGGSEKIRDGLNHLEATGYIRWQDEDAVALLDVAPIGPEYLPGHAHADTLSFELSLFGHRVLVNSGTSCYGLSEERLRQRGTSAHNTVELDGMDSSEVWGGFRVARRARPIDLHIAHPGGCAVVSCFHDGYHRLPGRPTHCREWQLSRREIKVVDRISGGAQAVGRFFFHPCAVPRIHDDGQGGEILLTGGEKIFWEIKGGVGRVVDATYHPEFGLALANKCLEVTFGGTEVTVRFIW